MDGPSNEHSDSDSGESWTLLENNSVYADEPPEYLDDHERIGAQHHEKDEDTDGISIISDSDHDAPTPPPGDIVREKYQVLEENHLSERNISDFVSVDPHLPSINDDHDAAESNEFFEDSHVRHKTYVHKRNKRLSTVLNIIVLGSVITAAGVAIGHMWGARHDCTMQTTSSINKILSNLYKLQEENAYLKTKIKELTQTNTHHIQQQKLPLKQNKCRKVFEESLSNNEPRKFTKCVDEHNVHENNLIDHFTKPKPEKEFVADMDKLKTVYLQNKSWLDYEISRRGKIEEELLKKYNDEVNSEKQQIEEFNKNNEVDLTLLDAKNNKDESEESLHKLGGDESLESSNFVKQKISYADSLKTEQKPKSKRNVERYEGSDNSDWSMLNSNINYLEEAMRGSESDFQKEQDKIAKFKLNEAPSYASGYVKDLTDSMQSANKNSKGQDIINDDKTEEDINFRRNEEWYKIEDYNRSKYVQETKNKRKKEKREAKKNAKKQRLETSKDKNNEDTIEFTTSEREIMKDDRYVVNKFNKEKKKNGYINSNKKQKRKHEFDKSNMKGEFGDKFQDVATPVYFALKNSDEHDNSDYVPIENNPYDTEKSTEKFPDKVETLQKGSDNEQADNWFEKRAVLRKEARRKFYEQFGETSINNSSWYFRRMRKREQCRAKGDNSTFKKFRKENKGHKVKK